METKRTKLWRRKQSFRVFKARMLYYATFERECYYYVIIATKARLVMESRFFLVCNLKAIWPRQSHR